MNLRTAFANIHRDPFWWRKVLTGGAIALTIFGIPWTAGLVVESFENIRKGYPVPLPHNGDPSGRYIIGLFAALIDFIFFLLLPAVIGLVLLCVVLGFAVGGAGASDTLFNIGGAGLAFYVIAMFALGVAPVGRLMYTAEGRPEVALGIAPLREALRADMRLAYARARLHSLPAYLPALLGAAACLLLTQYAPEGALTVLALLTLLWLTASALVYAHLVVAQLYADTARPQPW